MLKLLILVKARCYQISRGLVFITMTTYERDQGSNYPWIPRVETVWVHLQRSNMLTYMEDSDGLENVVAAVRQQCGLSYAAGSLLHTSRFRKSVLGGSQHALRWREVAVVAVLEYM